MDSPWRSELQETIRRHGGFRGGGGGCEVLGRGPLGARPRRVRTEGAEAPKALSVCLRIKFMQIPRSYLFVSQAQNCTALSVCWHSPSVTSSSVCLGTSMIAVVIGERTQVVHALDGR